LGHLASVYQRQNRLKIGLLITPAAATSDRNQPGSQQTGSAQSHSGVEPLLTGQLIDTRCNLARQPGKLIDALFAAHRLFLPR
jgi:hypothetical protein